MNISLVIPAYNEESRLPSFLHTISEYYHRYPQHFAEVLVVDDGSTDNTAQRAEEFKSALPILKVIRQAQNKGKGAAIARGVMHAAGEAVVFMDADGATPITELPKMMGALKNYQIGVGNRWMKESQTERSSTLRHLAGWANRTYMRLFGLGNFDTMCGFKGYHKDVARDLFSNLLEERWLFDTEIAYKAVKRGYTIKHFPIAWESKEGSKLSSTALLTSGLKILPLVLRIRKEEMKKNQI